MLISDLVAGLAERQRQSRSILHLGRVRGFSLSLPSLLGVGSTRLSLLEFVCLASLSPPHE